MLVWSPMAIIAPVRVKKKDNCFSPVYIFLDHVHIINRLYYYAGLKKLRVFK